VKKIKLAFEVRHQMCLSSLLESQDGAGLEAKLLSSGILRHLPDQPLEREAREEETHGFLVVPDFKKGSGLHTS
jgi:hypothetical protein